MQGFSSGMYEMVFLVYEMILERIFEGILRDIKGF